MVEPRDVLDEGYALYDAAHVEEALDKVRPLLSQQSALTHENRMHLLRLIGRCSIELGDYDRARQAFDATTRIAADLDRFDLSVSLYYLCRFDEAEMIFETLPVYPETEAELYWFRGLLAERQTDYDRAYSLFRRAARLDPKRFIIPQKMDENEVRDIFETVVDELPMHLRTVALAVPLLVEDLPSDELLMDSNNRLHPMVLGVYDGPLAPPKSPLKPAPESDRIVLFRLNISKFAHNRDDLYRELGYTIIQEIAHHFGWTEEELESGAF